jgi:glycine/D-amino acid oxidase-like deaminating enzyme
VQFVSETLRLSDDWKIEQEWSGIMGFTPTKTPILKQIDQHRYVAAGLSGMGIAIGMEVGQGAAKMVED